MKSKAEIVVETLLHYNLKNRGYNAEGDYCTYLDKSTGNKRAVGRCIQESEIEKVSEYEEKHIKENSGSPTVGDLARYFNDLDYLLSPEYRGHNAAFWRDLQRTHDMSLLWTENGFKADERDLAYFSRVFGVEVAEAVKVAFAEKSA